jgi:two-component system, LytTR family, response regulator
MKVNRIKAIIVDDEKEGREVLESLLQDIPGVEIIAIAEDADKGITAILEHQPDLVFLDIRMPRKSGLEMARELSALRIRPTIVFVTAYDEYAIQALRLSAFDFLLKPVDPDELDKVIQRFESEKIQEVFDRKIAKLLMNLYREDKIRLNNRAGFILIDPREIIYIQADGNYSEIIMSSMKKEFVTQNLGTLVEMLPGDSFFRTSRSCLINLAFLKRLDRKSRKCELEHNGETFTIHVSRDLIGDIDSVLK